MKSESCGSEYSCSDITVVWRLVVHHVVKKMGAISSENVVMGVVTKCVVCLVSGVQVNGAVVMFVVVVIE